VIHHVVIMTDTRISCPLDALILGPLPTPPEICEVHGFPAVAFDDLVVGGSVVTTMMVTTTRAASSAGSD
jgi:hypothetical protein